MKDPRDGLLAEVPAQLQASVGDDGCVEDGEAGAVGGGAGRRRDRLPRAHALGIPRMREALDEARLGLHHELHPVALRQPGPRP